MERTAGIEETRAVKRFRCLAKDCGFICEKFERHAHVYFAHFARVWGVDLAAQFEEVSE